MFVVIACAMIAACSQNPIQTVVIDKSDCVGFTNGFGSPCAKWEEYGSFTIIVNGTTNACTISFLAPNESDAHFLRYP